MHCWFLVYWELSCALVLLLQVFLQQCLLQLVARLRSCCCCCAAQLWMFVPLLSGAQQQQRPRLSLTAWRSRCDLRL